MANVTGIAISELAFCGVTIPEERDFIPEERGFIPDELPPFRKALVFLQLNHVCVEQRMVQYSDT